MNLRRLALALLVPVMALGTGCSKSPRYDPGCYLNDAVKAPTRRDVEAAAERFYGLLRARHYEDAYAEAADQLRTRVAKNDIAQAWTGIAEILTIPDKVTTEEIAVAVFPEGTRGPQEVQCVDPSEPEGGRKMMATDQPFQAYLVQSAQVGDNTYNFGSVWFFEKGKWRLATFGAKPRKMLGKDWRHYLEVARAELAKGNERNAALLYNLTMDLLVPAPWVRPDKLDEIAKEQRTIIVENLPAGRRLEWVATDGTVFNPYLISYDVTTEGLALRLFYEIPQPIDTTAVAAQAPTLARFVRGEFPEYQEIFSTMVLEAVAPVTHEPVWSGTFPFREP